MFPIKDFRLSNFIIIELYYILISIKVSLAGVYIDMKKISLYDSYFIILDSGLYLYDFNTLDYISIYEFSNELGEANNIINITELYSWNKAYIFCLINEYLFIYNEYTYKIMNYRINEIVPFNDYYYNIMPYKIENNNISFIIAFNKDINKLIFYFYNFAFDAGINQPKTIEFNDINIQNKMIRCQINSNYTLIICFYHTKINSDNYFASTIFNVKVMSLKKGRTSTNLISFNIKQIKLATSYNDKFFVCFANDGTPSSPNCLINEDDSYEFNEIGCKIVTNWSPEYKVFYFNATDDFMLISRGYCTAVILRNFDNSIKLCKQNIFEYQANDYYIIYINEYKTVNYSNFSTFVQHNDISILENNKKTEYIEEIKDSINNSQDKEELIAKLNYFIKNTKSVNYIDENKELIIHKDEMTVAFTSTNIQKINEDSNSNSTTINLGKCETVLKNIYKIPKESNLYILKIDLEQENKNYPLIEYEVFYPLEEGKMELLNLSFCDSTDIELSIPITINDTIDKYNPKSNYYNDICTKATSASNTDISLNDRKNEFIKNNMSLCEENCELTSYDNDKKRAKCSCKPKNVISLDRAELNSKNLLKNFIDIKKITNIEIIKCYKIVFNLNNMKNNYGSFIIIFIFFLYILCLIIFYCKSKKNLINDIIQIIEYKNKQDQLNQNNKIYQFKKNITTKKIKNIKSKVRIINSSLKNIKKETNLINFKSNTKINKKEENIENKNILKHTESELNSLSYKEALKFDKRTYCQYYCSLLKKKLSILFSFYPNKDYNSQIIKSFLFFFFYASDITVNALFFNDDTMHKIYEDSGEFNLSYQLPQIIYSFLISYVINFIIEYLSLSEDAIISIKEKKSINLIMNKKIINCLEIKFFFFFVTTFILLLIFWYYISCFCCIYENTQIHLFKDSLMSFGISLIYPICISILPGIFRIPALSSNKGDKSCIYKLSQFIEFF